MRRWLVASVLGLVLAVAGARIAPAGGSSVALVGAVVIDGTGAPPMADAVVLIQDGLIAALGPRGRVEIPTGAKLIDVSDKWIIPGLIDAHVHFFQSGGLYTRPDIIDLRAVRPYEKEIARIKARLEQTLARYLASGVTSVVDLGGPLWNFEVRKLARETLLAPRVAVAGPLLATYAPPELIGGEPPIVRIASPEQARAEVRRQLEHKPDLVKIWFVFPGPTIARELAWVRAAIAESHAGGIPVAIHATQLRVARAVVAAGADILAHSIDDRSLDEALLARMEARGVVYIPTLMVKEGYREVLGLNVRLSEIERRLGDGEAIASFEDLATLPRRLLSLWERWRGSPSVDPLLLRNLARAQAAGVTIAAGSDAGNIGTLHGPALHRELELMAAAGALSPMQVLLAATRGGAEAMGRGDELGTLEPGKLADMVVLDADPLADIRNTRRIDRVIKGGTVFEPQAILEAVGLAAKRP